MTDFDPHSWEHDAAAEDLPPLPADSMLATALSARQAAFCEAYAEGGNAAKAARCAGYAEGSARVTGARLLTKANIIDRIDSLRTVRNRARDLDRQLILERLEQTWQAAMAAGQINAAMRALRLMAELGGLLGANARDSAAAADLETGDPAGPVCRAFANASHRRRRERAAGPQDEAGQVGRGGKRGSEIGGEFGGEFGGGQVGDGHQVMNASTAEALVHKARLDLARTRPGRFAPNTTLRARQFLGTGRASQPDGADGSPAGARPSCATPEFPSG